jgi:hypothetical protein
MAISPEQLRPRRWLLTGLLQTVQYAAGTSQSQSITISFRSADRQALSALIASFAKT